jgi:hypothetical protein
MSDEQHRGDETETEVEGHWRRVGANDMPAEEPEDEGEAEVEAHIKHRNVRMD